MSKQHTPARGGRFLAAVRGAFNVTIQIMAPFTSTVWYRPLPNQRH
jgi:hypothetical protein